MMQTKTKFKQTEIGMIPEDWEVKEIQEVVSKLGDGLHGTPQYDNNGDYYFINGNNLVNGKIKVNNDTKKCSKEEFEKYKKELNNRTILVSINGTLGNIAVYDNEKIILGKSVCYLTVKTEYDLLFIRYVLKNKRFQNHIQNNATGTTIKNVSLKQMREYQFEIPKHVDEQSAIAKILSDLDSKIELNHQMNKTLEAIGRAIFKHWFIDFEFPNEEGKPYKSCGSRMKDSEFGKIPLNWEVKPLEDVTETIFSGGTPDTRKEEYWNGEYPWLSSGETRENFIINTEKTITKEGIENSSTRLAKTGDIVIASAGQGATRGQTSMCLLDTYINQSIVVLRKKENIMSNFYLFFNLSMRYPELRAISDSHSIRGSLTTQILKTLNVILPSPMILSSFDLLISPMIKRIQSNLVENTILSQIRDSLLPKLMSGKIRVPVEA